MKQSERISESLRLWSGYCRGYQSEFYADLLSLCANNYDAKGRLRDVLSDWQGDPVSANLPLRLLAGIHECVLKGSAPRLASHYYPVAGVTRSAEAAWPEFLEVLNKFPIEIKRRLSFPPQTNDVQRSAALLLGYLSIVKRFQQPLQIRELGASAGLNLLWDKFHYILGDSRWGSENSPVHLSATYDGPSLDKDVIVKIADRIGCDNYPRDITREEERLILESNIWPTQTLRLETFRAAAKLADANPPIVEKASAAAWLSNQLDERRPDSTLVIVHSAMWSYMPPEDQKTIHGLIMNAGESASDSAPLAWLRLEFPDGKRFEDLRVTLWPDGKEHLLATVNTRTKSIRYLAN